MNISSNSNEDKLLPPAEVGKCFVFPGYHHPTKTPLSPHKSIHRCMKRTCVFRQ